MKAIHQNFSTPLHPCDDPVKGSVISTKGSVIPAKGSVIPTKGSVIPTKGSVIPAKGSVIPAKAGIQSIYYWTPVFTGVTACQ